MTRMAKTDSEIRNEVSEALQQHPFMDISGMHIQVLDGIVYLKGRVNSYIQKPLAYEITGRIAGVRNLAEELDVVCDFGQPSDASIEAAIYHLIKWRTTLKSARVMVNVDKGIVTFSGSVGNYYQKRVLIHAAEDIIGVRGISDEVKIFSPHDPPGYKQVMHALQNCATIDAFKLHINLENGAVQLSGFATSLEEKRDAERAVWSVPGVTEVNNKIVVSYMNDLAY